jgi:hypothetical protein
MTTARRPTDTLERGIFEVSRGQARRIYLRASRLCDHCFARPTPWVKVYGPFLAKRVCWACMDPEDRREVASR